MVTNELRDLDMIIPSYVWPIVTLANIPPFYLFSCWAK
jgi:hypothetical protein